jgi:hypothetical protein
LFNPVSRNQEKILQMCFNYDPDMLQKYMFSKEQLRGCCSRRASTNDIGTYSFFGGWVFSAIIFPPSLENTILPINPYPCLKLNIYQLLEPVQKRVGIWIYEVLLPHVLCF